MKKIAKYSLMGLLAIISISLLYAYLAYPAGYVNRVLRWRDSDVYDYQKFPERPLAISDSPFEFSLNLDEEHVRTQLEIASGVDDFDSFLEKNRTQAFIVIQDDTILYEKYFNGASRDSIVTSFSIAKSFTSALIGIAISEGHIHSVDDPITDYLPELAERDPAFANITIRNLLMMSSGIKYTEFPFVNGDDAKTTSRGAVKGPFSRWRRSVAPTDKSACDAQQGDAQAGILVWFVLDTSLSIYYKVYFNAAFNTVLLILAMLPVVLTRRYFAKE